ncbi:conserved hypothetical protein [Theileria orientalis strain Shintoku]|uniref:Uncharacterized protein n=1 Tax=Theileria orientalis strain Shintoku TaxID=869250 RepID=J4D5H3_THEOR|nr:conserved hypothetical protein [Theileria orientalis strain Shintoku]BAM38965.1 conserved hypothetical protein [Theileria orientalis strain Shintoku]|eukprot:XP_009689266.1 conserved hypothetical protein [Theileria orientalis strain Shintoku]
MPNGKDYYQYIPQYNIQDCIDNGVDAQNSTTHPVYKNIPYYNNEIKSLMDKTESYSESVDDLYFKDKCQNSVNLDSNLIYNDGYPSYRMVNTPNPRVVEVTNKTPSSSSASCAGTPRNDNTVASEIAKFTEAIRDLTSRLPAPPSSDLLRSVHPTLAVKLQLTYLKAYIQNQQLLLDLKSKLDAGYGGSDYAKYSANAVFEPEFYSSGDQRPVVELRMPYPQLASPALTSDPNMCNGQMNYAYDVEPVDYAQNAQFGQINCPQLTNYPNFYYPLVQQPNYALPQLANEPKTNYPQLTDYPQISDAQSYQYANGNGAYEKKNFESKYSKRAKRDDRPVENPALLLPDDYKDRVKYNSAKNSFVSVYYNALGIRKRKSFSINKFGTHNALKLAMDFSNQPYLKTSKSTLNRLSGASDARAAESENETITLAHKERVLVKKVCEHALSVSPKICEDFELFELALSMDRVRGLVYSLGANLWMCIYYKDSRRHFQCYKVEEHGFVMSYQLGRSFFEKNPKITRSKLSGVLSYWIDPVPTKTLVIIFKVGTNLLIDFSIEDRNTILVKAAPPRGTGSRNGSAASSRSKAQKLSSDSQIYVGRFELEVYGGFLQAKKASQDWFSHVKSSHFSGNMDWSRRYKTATENGENFIVDNTIDQGSAIYRLGFMYYDHSNKMWVVVNKSHHMLFSADELGHRESKKQALTLRQQHIVTSKINSM